MAFPVPLLEEHVQIVVAWQPDAHVALLLLSLRYFVELQGSVAAAAGASNEKVEKLALFVGTFTAKI